MIKVLVCDDQVVVCEGLEMILNSDKTIEVVGIAHDGYQALELVAEKNPDIVLMDLKMPGMNGIQATREIQKGFPQVKVLVLTTFGEDEWVFDAIQSGAVGYLLKGTPRQELIQAVKGTAEGRSHIDPAVGGKILSHVAKSTQQKNTTINSELSERELEILVLIAQGLTNAEIAEKLFLTKGTVRNYVSAVLTKLQVEDRTQAAILAVRHGLVD
ncbi:MAG: response regulator transcription factor [Chloroflexota bacterium]